MKIYEVTGERRPEAVKTLQMCWILGFPVPSSLWGPVVKCSKGREDEGQCPRAQAGMPTERREHCREPGIYERKP